jgi:hypothetical protein
VGGGDLALSFRAMEMDDLRLMHEWLQRPHVRRWWSRRETYEEVRDSYSPAIEGSDPTDLYLVLLEGREIGFIQTYLVLDYPEYASLIGRGEGTAGVDLFHRRQRPNGEGHRKRDTAPLRLADRLRGGDDAPLCGWAGGCERRLGSRFRKGRLPRCQRIHRRRERDAVASA